MSKFDHSLAVVRANDPQWLLPGVKRDVALFFLLFFVLPITSLKAV